MKEIREYNWEEVEDKAYRRLGEDIVLKGSVIYNYDDDGWRYAPDIYYEYLIEHPELEDISEEEAKNIVEKNGGTKFDEQKSIIFATDEDGKLSGID